MLITSNAFNFVEDTSSGVNLRTGIFSKTIKIGYICSNNLNGPNIDVNITFNQYSNENQGFGLGWELNFSRYNASRQELFFSNGKRFHAIVDFQNRSIQIPDLISKEIIVEVVTENKIRIIYKDGTIEYLNSNGLLTRIENSDGRFINITWLQQNGQYRVSKVANTLTINYGHSFTSVISNVNSPIPTTTRLFITDQNGSSCLDSIRLSNDDDYQFDMENYHDNYFIIKSVKYPNGLIEYIYYQELSSIAGLFMPIKVVDYVSCEPGGEARTYKKQFIFSKSHYLGKRAINQFGAPIIWEPHTDLLYTCQQGFEYTVTETLSGNSIKRRYNKFHLLTLEEFWQGNPDSGIRYKTIEYQYPCELTKPINQQPVTYYLPKFIITNHITAQSAYERSQRFNYDDYGNLLFETNPSYSINYTYYSAEGDGEKCPADPHGFIRHLKHKYFISNDARELKAITYEYTLLGQRLVVLSKESCNGYDSHFQYHEAYNDDVSSTFGMLGLKTEYLDGRAVKTYHYERVLADNILTKKETCIGTDGTRLVSSISENINTGLTVAIRHDNGLEDNFEYDLLGRIVKKTFAKGSKNELLEAIEYSQNGRRQSITHPNSLIDYIDFDYFGRKITKAAGTTLTPYNDSSLALSSEGSQFIYARYQYDHYGNLIKEILNDRIDSSIIRKEYTFEYNDHGDLSKKNKSRWIYRKY